MKMVDSRTLEFGTPDKNCGVNCCSECPSSICKQLSAIKEIEIKKPVVNISKEIIDEYSMQPFCMHIIFSTG
jgi:hypothetical protein